MIKKRFSIFYWIAFFFLILILIVYFLLQERNKKTVNTNETQENSEYNSNIINDVNYVTRDLKGNEYKINAEIGEIDISNSNIIFLTNVSGLINLTNSNSITITSKFGKYNINNNDTIFSKDVVIDYLENNVTGDYLDFSLARNSMIISKNVIYTNINNVLRADVIEINIRTKDTKIFMLNSDEKVTVRNQN
tara:strand:+ start:261 stop:836 length:576 start_codon:yes stop_codon:yes gene_type:complete